MHVRKLLAGVVTTAVALSAVVLTAGPAPAVYNPDPDDTGVTPVAADLIGVGSDTSQHAIKLVAATPGTPTAPHPRSRPTPARPAARGTITAPERRHHPAQRLRRRQGHALRRGQQHRHRLRPVLLGQSSAETTAGLQTFPFALDTLEMAVSGNVASNAPANLTPAQIVSIYKGDVTNWNQVGGTRRRHRARRSRRPGPAPGASSPRQLKADERRRGRRLSARTVAEVQEHDDTPDQERRQRHRAVLRRAGPAARRHRCELEGGFAADRAVYNVVRGADVSDAEILAVFGSDGYFCSAAAKPLIEAAGFKQLPRRARAASAGSRPSRPPATSRWPSVADHHHGDGDQRQRLVGQDRGDGHRRRPRPAARWRSTRAPPLLQSGVPLVSGKATRDPAGGARRAHLPRGLHAGREHGVRARRRAPATGTVQKATSSITETFPKKVAKGKRAKGTVTVTLGRRRGQGRPARSDQGGQEDARDQDARPTAR